MITPGDMLKGLTVGLGSLVVSYNLLLPPEAPLLAPQPFPALGPRPEWRLQAPEGTLPDPEPAFHQDIPRETRASISAGNSWDTGLSLGAETWADAEVLRHLEPPSSGPMILLTAAAESDLTPAGTWPDLVLSPQEQMIFQRMNARRGEPLMTPEEFLQALYTPSAILPLPDEERPSPLAQWGLSREEIRFHRGKLETLFPGDEMYLYSRQLGQNLIMRVDRIQDHRDGSLSWHGHLKGLDGHFTISFTQGPQFTLARMETPWGLFRLDVQGDRGWLVREPHRAAPPWESVPAVQLSHARRAW